MWPQIRPLRRFAFEHPKLRLELEFKLKFEVDYFDEDPETIFKVDMRRDLAGSARAAKKHVEEEVIPWLRDWDHLYDLYGETVDCMARLLDRLQVLASSSWEGAEPR